MGVFEGGDTFVTSDNRTIKLKEEWYTMKTWPFGITSYEEFVDKIIDPQVNKNSTHEDQVYPKDSTFLLLKLITPEVIIQLLREVAVDFSDFNRMLDICSGPALIPRVFKLLGLCNEIYGLDIQDRSQDFSDDAIRSFLATLRALLLEEEDEAAALKLFLGGDKVTKWPAPVSLPLVADLSKDFSLDHYFVSDFLDFDNDGMTFDLITTYAGSCYFQMDDFFEKISSLLAKNGIYYLMDTNFYHMFAESLQLPLGTPWLHARLTKDDLFRYYEEKHPQLVPYVERGFFVKDTHNSVLDMIACAEKYGLELVTYRRSYSQAELDGVHYASGGNLNFIISSILPECQMINPKVEFLDLLAQNWTIVLRKK